MRIAVVDDDPAQLDLVDAVIRAMGHACHAYADGMSLLKALQTDMFDLLIVDWELPDIAGPDIVRQVRGRATTPVPILMMTNRSDERDIVKGLECGADDYLVKSARVMELRARLMALLRRGGHTLEPAEEVWGRYRFDARKRRVWVDDAEIVLKSKEFELALTLFRHLDLLVSRTYLIESVWGRGADVSVRSLDVYLSHLRSKLQLRPEHGMRLASAYSHGYRLEMLSGKEGSA